LRNQKAGNFSALKAAKRSGEINSILVKSTEIGNTVALRIGAYWADRREYEYALYARRKIVVFWLFIT